MLTIGSLVMGPACRVWAQAPSEPSQGASPQAKEAVRFYIGEYQVKGARQLSKREIGDAVYPFLGAQRTEDDVKSACAALEKVYRTKGFGAATVQYDPQVGKGGVIRLRVLEGEVGRLRVKGARYFSPAQVKAQAPSLKEGKAINFDDVTKDVAALNQLADRRVTPSLKPGAEPGRYDVDLEVQDKCPVHGSVELNNRQSPNTKPLRLNVAISDSNLWQAGHTAGFSYQVAPQRRLDSEVFSGYYSARFEGIERSSFMVQATKQNSNISTLGGTTVAGPGETIDLSTSVNLPNGRSPDTGKEWADFFHSLSFGVTYKHYKQTIATGGSEGSGRIVTPITYYPFHFDYLASIFDLTGKGAVTELNLSLNFHFRGMGSSPSEFDLNRYNSDGGYVYLRGELSHTQDTYGGFQVFGKVGGQLANQPLVSSEQFSGGGLSSARGYMEAQAVGDDGVNGTVELRTPSILGALGSPSKGGNATGNSAAKSDWRFHIFGDAVGLTLHDSLPNQKARFGMVSVGTGTRLTWQDFLSGSLDAGYPIYTLGETHAGDWRLTFRASASF